MIERGNGRTGDQTNWHLMDVNSMWACLQDHDTTNHWKQVAGWRKVCDLAQIHLGRLQEYRRGLAEAWPPETSAASGTYLAQLDDLIIKVRHTHDAAAANYAALSAATQAIGSTRAELRKIHEEYATKLHQKQAYDATAADPKAIMGNRVVESPVTDGDLERLNVQARSMMFNLSGELQQAQATLQKPPAMPRTPRQPEDPDAYGGVVAPVIPPITPVSLPAPTNTSPTTQSRHPITPSPSSVPPIGPVLGSAPATNLPTSSITPSGIQTPGTTGSLSPVGPGTTPAPPLISGGMGPSTELRRGPSGAPGRPTSGGADTNVTRPAIPIRPTPSTGGLIGGVPGLIPGSSVDKSAPIRRVNPVGGVIGGGAAGTSPTGAAGSRPSGARNLVGSPTLSIGGAPGAHGSTSRPRDRHDGQQDLHRWDPDHPWETERGVAPVVLPPEEEGPIDPGPAIGFNR